MELELLKKKQLKLSKKVRVEPLKGEIKLIAGCDVSYSKKENKMVAAFVVFSFPELKVVEWGYSEGEIIFPYIPSYLSFRELPQIINSYKNLKERPELLIVDGQGILHPRKLGIASHIGVILDIPTIGCAKSSLIGEFKTPGLKRGDWSPIYVNGELRGACLRTKEGVKPVYVSPGHKVNLKDSIYYVLKSCKKFRLPEPVRAADQFSKRLIKEESGGFYGI